VTDAARPDEAVVSDLEHVSKASGLGRFFESIGLDPARCAGIGDTTNDQPIAEACRWFGCPANAAAELKPKADVVPPRDRAGAAVDSLTRLGVL